MRVMALFSTSFVLQNACVRVRIAPGQGHLSHIDTFLVFCFVLFSLQNIPKQGNIRLSLTVFVHENIERIKCHTCTQQLSVEFYFRI